MTYENYLRNRANRLGDSSQGNCTCDPTGELFCSCSSSRILNIFRTEARNVFTASVFLDCSGACSGHDSDLVFSWRLNMISGNVRIQGATNRSEVTVVGAGEFTLTLFVLFRCRRTFGGFEDCPRELTSPIFRL